MWDRDLRVVIFIGRRAQYLIMLIVEAPPLSEDKLGLVSIVKDVRQAVEDSGGQ